MNTFHTPTRAHAREVLNLWNARGPTNTLSNRPLPAVTLSWASHILAGRGGGVWGLVPGVRALFAHRALGFQTHLRRPRRRLPGARFSPPTSARSDAPQSRSHVITSDGTMPHTKATARPPRNRSAMLSRDMRSIRWKEKYTSDGHGGLHAVWAILLGMPIGAANIPLYIETRGPLPLMDDDRGLSRKGTRPRPGPTQLARTRLLW